MAHLLPLAVLCGHAGLGVLLPVLFARRGRLAWRAVRRVEAAKGYRQAPHRDTAAAILPSGLLPHVSGAVALGSLGVWPALWAALRHAPAAAYGSPVAPPAYFGLPFDLRAAVAVGFALVLGVIVVASLRLLGRARGALGTARAVGGVAVALGVLFAFPSLAWPVWAGGDAIPATALGLFSALAGVILLRAAGLAHEAELERWAEPALFDEA